MREYISKEKYELIKDNLDSKKTYIVVEDNEVDKVAFMTNNIDGKNKNYEISVGSEPEPLKVIYWSYNDVITTDNEHTLVKPTISGDGSTSKLLIYFKFNKAVDETTVNKNNFIVTPNSDVPQYWYYDLTYPALDTVLLSIPFSQRSEDPYMDGYGVKFNGTFLTDIYGTLYIQPMVISNNEPAIYNNISEYTYKVANTINYDKTNMDKLHISFVTPDDWIPIRTNIVNDWGLVDINGVFPDIPASAVYKLNNVICLEFDMIDIPLGFHDVGVNWRQEEVYPITITLDEPEE